MDIPQFYLLGGGYHIYQPIEGIVFENDAIFNEFNSQYDLFKEFLRFSKKFSPIIKQIKTIIFFKIFFIKNT